MSWGAEKSYRFERTIAMAAEVASSHANRYALALGASHPLARAAKSIALEISTLSPHQYEAYLRRIERGDTEKPI